MPEHDWSWSQDNISVRLAMEPAAIGTDEPLSVFETPHEVISKLAREYGRRLETTLAPLNRMSFSGDWQPRIANMEGGQPVVPLQRVALQLLELRHSHPAGTYLVEAAEAETIGEQYEIPSLRPGDGTILAERVTSVNEPISGFYNRTTIGRELRAVDFEKHASLKEREAAIRNLIEASGVQVETARTTGHAVEIRNDGAGVVIPRQGGTVQPYLSTALYAVCMAKARQESGPAPNPQELAAQTLAAAWTVNMAFAGACLGQWPSAPEDKLKAAGRLMAQDAALMKMALDLNRRLEDTMVTRPAREYSRTAAEDTARSARGPAHVQANSGTATNRPGNGRLAEPVQNPVPA